MMTKQEKLALLEKHPEFLLEIMGFAASHLLYELNRKNLIKPDKNGKKPNAGACHPAILHALKRSIELQLDLSRGES
jgi:hypothetical protein